MQNVMQNVLQDIQRELSRRQVLQLAKDEALRARTDFGLADWEKANPPIFETDDSTEVLASRSNSLRNHVIPRLKKRIADYEKVPERMWD